MYIEYSAFSFHTSSLQLAVFDSFTIVRTTGFRFGRRTGSVDRGCLCNWHSISDARCSVESMTENHCRLAVDLLSARADVAYSSQFSWSHQLNVLLLIECWLYTFNSHFSTSQTQSDASLFCSLSFAVNSLTAYWKSISLLFPQVALMYQSAALAYQRVIDHRSCQSLK